MKKIIWVLVLVLGLCRCEKDRCDEGYKPYDSNGHEICIPEFLTGKDNDFKLGKMYVHEKLGVITLQNGVWINEENIEVVPE